MFDLTMPWWEFALRGAVCYVALLILLRLTGKRTFGEMSPFDIVVLIVVGGMLRPAVTGDDHSMIGPFISIAAILLLDKVLAKLSALSPRVDRLMEGRPVLLAKDGALRRGVLLRHSVSEAALDRELRAHGIHALDETQAVYLEANGRVSVLKRQG